MAYFAQVLYWRVSHYRVYRVPKVLLRSVLSWWVLLVQAPVVCISGLGTGPICPICVVWLVLALTTL